MKHILTLATLLIAGLFISCNKLETVTQTVSDGELMSVGVDEFEGAQRAKRVSYSSDGNSSYFETSDSFGLFIVKSDGTVMRSNVQVTLSGQDAQGNDLWTIDELALGKTLAEIMEEGTQYYAYAPYSASNDGISSIAGIKGIASTHNSSLPYDQSSSYTSNDLVIASNITGHSYGSFTSGFGKYSLHFSHAFAMLRFSLPTGSTKYKYLYSGQDFTPYLASSTSTKDIYQLLIRPDEEFNISVKYLSTEGKIYGFSFIYNKPLCITTEANHCYNLGEGQLSHEDLINSLGYDLAVDLGLPSHTKWASMDLRTDETLLNDLTLYDKADLQKIAGDSFAWGATTPDATALTPSSNLVISNTANDAAKALWGEGWQLPLNSDVMELYIYCTVEEYNSNPKVFKVTGPNGNFIYLPAAGYLDNSGVLQDGNSRAFTQIGEANYNSTSSVYVNRLGLTADNISEASDLMPYSQAANNTRKPIAFSQNNRTVIRPVYKTKKDIRSGGNVPESIGIDMGTGVLWAPFDLGVENQISGEVAFSSDGNFTNSDELAWLAKQHGDYFAFGEVTPKNFFSNGNWTFPTTERVVDNIIVGTEYDAAHANWGNAWELPTKADFDALIANSISNGVYVSTSQGNYPCYVFTSKTNGNTLIFPVTGQMQNGIWDSLHSMNCMFWMGQMSSDDTKRARWLNLAGDNVRYTNNKALGYNGIAIRPVIHPQNP